MIDPDVLAAQRTANAELAAMPHPDPRTPAGLAAIRARPPAPALLRPAPADLDADGIRLRVFAPGGAVAVLVRVHGGGFAVGAPEHDDAINARIARECGLVVASPAYRLAPGVTLQDEIADCAAAIGWSAARWPDLPVLLAGTSAAATSPSQPRCACATQGPPRSGGCARCTWTAGATTWPGRRARARRRMRPSC